MGNLTCTQLRTVSRWVSSAVYCRPLSPHALTNVYDNDNELDNDQTVVTTPDDPDDAMSNPVPERSERPSPPERSNSVPFPSDGGEQRLKGAYMRSHDCL